MRIPPHAPNGAPGAKKSGAANRIVSVRRHRERPDDKIIVVVKGRRAERRGVIVVVKQIIELREHLKVPLQLIMRAETQDSIARRKALTKGSTRAGNVVKSAKVGGQPVISQILVGLKFAQVGNILTIGQCLNPHMIRCVSCRKWDGRDGS